MAYRDGRAAFQMLDEVSKVKGVARRSGNFRVKNTKGEWHDTFAHELATGKSAEDVRRGRAIGAGVGGVIAGVPGLIYGGPLGGLAAGAAGAGAGYAVGNEYGWGKARGISGKKTDLYMTREKRRKAIAEYQETGKRPSGGSRQRKDTLLAKPSSTRALLEAFD